MKTLPPEITKTFFKDPDGWQKFNQEFKARATRRDPTLTAFDYFMAQVLRGRDWTKGVGALTNKVKRENGGRYAWKPYLVLQTLYTLEGRVKRVQTGGKWRTDLETVQAFKTMYSGLTDDALTKLQSLLPISTFFMSSARGEEIVPYNDLVLDISVPDVVYQQGQRL